MVPRAFITGLSGPTITAEEKAFLREASPWGLILFKRNIVSPEQVLALTNDFREICGRDDAPVLIDQEGGRVQRLGPPHWPTYPPGAAYGRVYDREPTIGLSAARLGGRLIAADLEVLGITVDCLPVADVPVQGADAVIGDRAYGTNPEKVAAIASALAQGLAEGGVLPVLKHLPGHGRATADSHLKLPVVRDEKNTLELIDFAAFRPLARLPLGMTAHVVFTAFDPELPATTSPTIIGQVIRGFIGFGGALMSDDIAMGALSGSIAERVRAALAAGCDIILHCNGKMQEMQDVASQSPILSGLAAQRTTAAVAGREKPRPVDLPAARYAFSRMMASNGATQVTA